MLEIACRFANAVEPQFIKWLENKYGQQTITRIKRLKA